MPTETETPAVEMLERAVAKMAYTKNDVADRQNDRDTKQAAASQASELEKAAPLERKNAQARYLVLKNRVDAAGAGTKEADRAEATATIHDTIKKWQTTAKNLSATLQGQADSIAPDESPGDKQNGYTKIQEESKQVQADIATLETHMATIDDAVKTLQASTPSSGQTGSQGRKRPQRPQRAPAGGKDKAAPGSAGADDDPKKEIDELKKAAEKANDELAAAQAEEQLAPAAARSAQADLQVAEQMLHASKERLTAAEAELIRIQRDYFVKRIVVGKPEGGWAVGEAILKQDIPSGYRLRWKAENADIEIQNVQGTKVRIKVGMLSVGITTVTATIEKIP